MITLKIRQKGSRWLLSITGPGDFKNELEALQVPTVKRKAAELVAASLARVPTEDKSAPEAPALGEVVAANIREALDADGRSHADIAESMWPHLDRSSAGRRLRKLIENSATRTWPGPDDFELLEQHLGIRAADLLVPRGDGRHG